MVLDKEGRDQTLSGIPTSGLPMNYPNPTALTPIGGGK